MRNFIRGLSAIALAASVGGCSTVMEANRPEPVDLTKYTPGQNRLDVVSQLGAPVSSIKDGQNSCDIYKLYTKGVNKVGKGAIILGEAAADVFTLGLAEVVTTTGEAVTKNKPHTTLICYSPDNRLVSIRDQGQEVAAVTPAATPTTTAAK